MYEMVVAPHAVRDLKRLPSDVLRRVDRAILELRSDPRMRGSKHLRDYKHADYRIRVGDYRILFDIDDARRVIVILRVGHRKDIYR